MKTNVKIAATLLALVMVFLVRAQPVSESDARYAARGWSILNAKAFKALGGAVESVTAETNATGEVQWYVVKMTKGAAVVAPSDEIEPVIAVLPGSDGVIPNDSPLRAMLVRDMANRLARTGGGLKLSSSSASATTLKTTTKWDKLKRYGQGRVLATSAAGNNPATIVRWLDGWNSDSTVGNVQTLRFWNQDNSTDYFTNPSIFNLYTPGNAYCGCVATAGSAVMHYFRVPSGNSVTRNCSYNGMTVELKSRGGTYDWSLVDGLNLKNGSSITLSKDAVDLLARVAYDCGVGCGMSYGDGGSGSYTVSLTQSFRDVFGVQNAQLVTKGGGDHGYGEDYDIGPENYPDIIYNQIRGGAPVVMGIDGHEVVACGYGYDADLTDYTYVFLGWGSDNDAWYALPKIDTKATAEGGWYTSTFIDELITEIAPFDDKFVAIVGQVVDADGEPVANDPVTMSNGEVVMTDANGFFGTRVSPKDPCYVTDSFGEEHAYTLGSAAQSTNPGGVASGALAAAMPDAMVIELLEPAVRVGGDDDRIFGSLTKALENVQSGETVEILKPTVFKKPVTVKNDCTIFATGLDASETPIRHMNDAVMTVDNGVTVTISNVCFQTTTTAAMVDVVAGGTLKLGRGCRLGPIKTDCADNLVVIGALTDPLYIACANAAASGDTFAKYETDYKTAADCAYYLLHATNTRLGGEADEEGNIHWMTDAPVPDSAAVAQVTVGEKSWNSRAITNVLEDVADVTEDVDIIVKKDDVLAAPFTPKGKVTLRGIDTTRPTLTTTNRAGFTLPTDAALVVSNIVFKGCELPAQKSFLSVAGGDLTMKNGAELRDFTGHCDNGSGTADLSSGVITMEDGAVITGCSAKGNIYGNGRGGAIYIANRADCTLNLYGGTITNCYSKTYGGGIYVNTLGTQPAVNLKGKLIIKNNWAGSQSLYKNDLCLGSALGIPSFKVVDALIGQVGILYSAKNNNLEFTGNDQSNPFITSNLPSNLSETEKTRTLRSFFSDATDGLTASDGIGAQAGKLVWIEDTRNPRQCEEDQATARLIDGNSVTFWWNVSDALEAAPDNTIVEVIAQDNFVPLISNVVVQGKNVTLRSDSESLFAKKLLRDVDVQVSVPSGSELVITNLAIYGCDDIETALEASAVTLFNVNGGTLRLHQGASIQNVLGKGDDPDGNVVRNANAITVYDGGTLEMSGGASVDTCYNLTEDPTGVKRTNAGAGGGILVQNATAHFHDMSVQRCRATWGGGVYACNKAKIYISGSSRITENCTPDDDQNPNNLRLSADSELIVDGEITERVGLSQREYDYEHPGMTNLIATVSPDWTWSVMALTNSAAHFHRDADSGLAVAVTNGAKRALIVWCGAVKDGVYTNAIDGVEYRLAGEMPVANLALTLLPELFSKADIPAALSPLADVSVRAKITTLSEYDSFRTWANGVKGGTKAVKDSDRAYLSYAFNTNELLSENPEIEISQINNTADGLTVRVVVRDGVEPVAVAAEKVASMFEATDNLGDWSKKVTLTVENPVQNADNSITFTVKPTGNPAATFIRLRY